MSDNQDNNHINPPRGSSRPRPNLPPTRRSAYSRPAYPYYGLYSRKRTPPWLIKSRLIKPKPKRPIGLILILVTLVAFSLTILALVLGLFAGGATAASAGYAYYARGLSLDKDYSLTFETSRIYDRNGVLLYEKLPEEGAREYVTIDKVPKVLIDATLSAEDPTFYENQGFDVQGILRAIYQQIQGGSSGASTITQQVARLLYLPPEERYQRTPERKIREIILATMLTDKFTKDQILEKYLNNIFYGNLAYGIQAASEGYFGKEPKDLNLAEASMLAGLPQLPSEYDPTLNYDLARRRQRRVLDLMVSKGRITQDQADAAFSYDIKANLKDRRKRATNIRAPHFVNYILGQLNSENGSKQLRDAGVFLSSEEWKQGGFDVYTTVDVKLVDEAEQVARKRIEDLKKQNATNAAMVVMRPGTGEILAMLGSIDYNDEANDGQFNVAINPRQPGSSIKPITYVTAMEKGWTAATVIADVTTTFPGGYKPQNFDGTTHGPVTVRNALGSSLNIPAVKALQFTGVQGMMDEAAKMGIQFQQNAAFYGLPLTLGGGEVRLLDLTGAYAVFDNLGQKAEPVGLLKIARHGKTVYEFDPNNVKRTAVVSPQNAYIITNILSDNKARQLAFAANNPLVLPNRAAAAKTGTTNDFRDSWTVGYTPDLVVGVWVGRNDNKPMLAVAGSIGGGQIWNDFMRRVYDDPNLSKAIQQGDKPLQKDFVRPADIVEVEICVDSGLLPNADCPQKRVELFAKGSVPKEASQLHKRVRVPKVGGVSSDPYFKPEDGRDNTYCIAGDDYPADLVEYKLFYNYPPDLRAWGTSQGRLPPPTQPCPPYVAPTPTPMPTVVVVDTPVPADNNNGNNSVPPNVPPSAPVANTPAPPRPASTPTPTQASISNIVATATRPANPPPAAPPTPTNKP